MPVEFRMESKSGNVLENTRGCSRDSVRVLMAYDGSGRRVSKTRGRKERDDETELNYFGARYLDPMLGLWTSVDPARQFSSPYLYAGNGVNPVNGYDTDGLLWEYAQNSGRLTYINDKTGARTKIINGYAGKGKGLNNSKWEAVEGFKDKPDAGPLPAGKYTIGPIEKNHNGKLWAMMLIPDPENEMYGRKDFMIHGAHPNDHFDSSEGCMIFGPDVRKKIGASGDNNLIVVPDAIEDIQPDGHVEIGDIDIE